MKNTSLLLLALLLGARAAAAGFYVEPRISALHLGGTPNIGDVGVTVSSSEPSTAFSLGVGYEAAPRFALELRYTGLGDVAVQKRAPSLALFPTTNPVAPVLTPYLYQQRTRVVSVAAPLQLAKSGGWSLTVAPLVQFEQSRIELYFTGPTFVVQTGPIYREKKTTAHFGAEVSAGYAFNDHAAVTLGYTYSPLRAFDAQLVNFGLRLHF